VIALLQKWIGTWGKRTVVGGVIAAGLMAATGCTVRMAEAPPPRYYYRTRLVYTANGPVYVRERVYEPQPAYAPPPPTYTAAPEQAPAPAPVAESPAAESLQPLVAPIALYSDPLIAIILPGSTYPQQLQEANGWLASYPQPPQGAIDAQPWAPSVKALVHYPTVLSQLTSDMQWTDSLGSAYLNQPSDLMQAIQQLRAQAVAQGNLVSNQQQTVIQDGGVIAIQPANPDVIYVPQYDPVVVYTSYRPLYYGNATYVTGPWLDTGVYWTGGVIFRGDWHGGYYYRDGRWGRDYAWRVDRGRYWARDTRYGPPPRIARDRYVYAHDVRGREAEIHRSMVEHAEQRHQVQERARVAGPERSAPRANPLSTPHSTPQRTAPQRTAPQRTAPRATPERAAPHGGQSTNEQRGGHDEQKH
jgi:hypothetical protein